VKHSRCSLSSIVIASKVDYCNVAFAGLARCELDRIQSVLNAAARLTAFARKFDHATPLLANLHWLRVPEHIQYMRSCAPLPQRCSTTVSDIAGSWTWSRVVGCVQRPRLKFWCRPHVVQPSVTAPSLSPVLEPETVYLQICDSSGPFLFLNVI